MTAVVLFLVDTVGCANRPSGDVAKLKPCPSARIDETLLGGKFTVF
jgi:hypothetical protein